MKIRKNQINQINNNNSYQKSLSKDKYKDTINSQKRKVLDIKQINFQDINKLNKHLKVI